LGLGNFPLKLGKYAIDGDTELVPAEVFDDPMGIYPVSVSASATYYPDAHDETTSVDGVTEEDDDGAAWATLVGAAGDNAYDTTTDANCVGWYVTGSKEFKNLRRGIFLFDSSGLPDACTITNAVFSVYGHTKNDPDSNTPNINVYSSDPASNVELVGGDYNSLGAIAFCDTAIAYGDFSTAGYNDFTLNAAGKAAISKTGVTKFGTREVTHDVGNSAPTKTQAGWTELKIYWADNGSNKPKLVATYTTAPDPPTNFDATDTRSGEVRCTWTKSDGATKYQLYRDGAPIGGELGDVATTDDGTAVAGTISNAGTVTASDGTQTAHVVLSLASEATASGTTYTYKVRAGHAGGWSGDSNTDNGHREPGAITYKWQVDDGGGYDDIVGGTTDPYNYTGAPAGTISNAGTVTATSGVHTDKVVLSLAGEATTDGTAYDYQCIVSASGASNSPQTSDNDDGYRTVGAITYQWQVDDGGGYDDIGGGTTDSYNYVGAPAGVVTPGVASATDGTETDKVILSLAGESVADGATYDYQCIVSSVDASNTPQTSDNDDGYRTTGAITYAWQRSAGDSNDTFGAIGGATTDPYNDVAAPAGIITPGNAVATDGTHPDKVSLNLAGESVADGAGRWYYCEVSATGTITQDSTHNRGHRTTGILTYQWQRSDGDADANYNTDLGITEAYDDNTAPAPTITPGNAVATDGTETAHIELTIAGESANVGAGRYYRCVLNATGTAEQTSGVNRGYRGTVEVTYQWYKSAGDADGGYGILGGATTDPYNDVAAPAGSITNAGTVTASDGTEEAHVVLSLAGEATADGAGHWYYCTLSMTGAASQDTAHNRGHRGVGAITFQWQMSDADSDANYNTDIGTTDPYNATEAPADGSGRYFRCVISSVDASNSPQTSTVDRGFRFVALIVRTDPCSGFSLLWGIVNGEIVEEGSGGGVTIVGFEYGLSTSYGANITSTGTWNTGDDFWERLFPLTPATVYHYRAMAYNGTWGYGDDRVFSTKGSPTLYEYLNTGGDGNSGAIYSANWTAEQFTSGNVSHTVTSVRVPLQRVGTYPGTVSLSITHADTDNFSTGADLTVAYLNGDAMSDIEYVWYDFDVSDISLSANASYAIVVRATSGNATDYIQWQKDAGGALAGAVGSHSSDSGITWVSDTPADYLFEIWGETVISVEDIQVFTGYIEDGDWLITITYKNTYAPYYPTEDVGTYFYLQLLDDTTVKAQVNCPTWGYRVGSIYISKAYADTLEWGSTDYKVRLIGSFGTNPYSDYAFQALDWTGGELIFLDKWVLSQARTIGVYDDTALTVFLTTHSEVLNATGETIFIDGIPSLDDVRPDIFEMTASAPEHEGAEYTHPMQTGTNWQVQLGATLSGILTNFGSYISIDGDTLGGFLIFIGFIVILGLMAAIGHLVLGFALGYVVLLVGAYLGLIHYALLGVVTFLMVAIFVYKVWLEK